LDFDTPPGLQVDTSNLGPLVTLSGQWTALALARDRARAGATSRLTALASAMPADGMPAQWDLSAVERITLTETQRDIFARIALLEAQRESPEAVERIDFITAFGRSILSFADHAYGGLAMFGRFVLDALAVVRRPARAPWLEISANVYNAGAKALPITALVAFLIGIVLSYLSAQQLRLFGANQYIVNILGLAVIRELGPVLSAILVAGRSGSAITAQIGVMRVTEELDAMLVMGIPHGLRLVLPRVIALSVAMPLLVMWTNIVALIGGALAAQIVLGIDIAYFARALPSVVPIANLWIGLGKGVAFGMLIALVACHFGFRIKPNSQSLGTGTTSSVVSSITVVILADAIFAIVFQNVGL
jgi:phospholipid/cholesterol/gamma-HCH transport system permease protein